MNVEVTGLKNETITGNDDVDVFGFTVRSIYVEVRSGTDSLSAALYRISMSMRITRDVTVVLAGSLFISWQPTAEQLRNEKYTF